MEIHSFLGVCGLAVSLHAVLGSAKADPTHEMDFWVGKWRCEGQMNGPNGQVTKTVATNTISKIMDGHVIQENFQMKGMKGMSLSVYDLHQNQWRQTWVDSSGGYLVFAGGRSGGDMVLSMALQPNGAVKRMVYSNIAHGSFDWDWEGSSDAGKTWKTLWHLHYTRLD